MGRHGDKKYEAYGPWGDDEQEEEREKEQEKKQESTGSSPLPKEQKKKQESTGSSPLPAVVDNQWTGRKQYLFVKKTTK